MTVSISTANSVDLKAKLTDAAISGDLADALSSKGIRYIEGSIEVFDAEEASGKIAYVLLVFLLSRTDSEELPKEDSDGVALEVMLGVGGFGTVIFVIIVLCRIHRVRQRLRRVPTTYDHTDQAEVIHRSHTFSIDFSPRSSSPLNRNVRL